MIAIRRITKLKGNQVTLKLPTNFKSKTVEIIILPYDTKSNIATKDSITKFAGKIKSFGDGLKYQKKIRSEWED